MTTTRVTGRGKLYHETTQPFRCLYFGGRYPLVKLVQISKTKWNQRSYQVAGTLAGSSGHIVQSKRIKCFGTGTESFVRRMPAALLMKGSMLSHKGLKIRKGTESGLPLSTGLHHMVLSWPQHTKPALSHASVRREFRTLAEQRAEQNIQKLDITEHEDRPAGMDLLLIVSSRVIVSGYETSERLTGTYGAQNAATLLCTIENSADSLCAACHS